MHTLFSDLLDLLFPPLCAACDRTIRTAPAAPVPRAAPPAFSAPLCGTCRAAVGRRAAEVLPESLDGVSLLAAYSYDFPLTRIVPGLKSRWDRRLADLVTGGIVDRLEVAGLARYGQAVVPLPLHHARRRERGYDQARLLARELARRLGIPCFPGVLRRVRATAPQHEAGRLERLSRLEDAFAPGRHAPRVAGRRVLLVDDVVTTGATMRSAAGALGGCAPSGLLAVCVARTPGPAADPGPDTRPRPPKTGER